MAGAASQAREFEASPAASPRPVILVFVRHYLPGYRCGPIRSVANLVAELGTAFDFRIVTLDRDAGEAQPYPDIATDLSWRIVGNARVLYLSPAQARLPEVVRILRNTPHDVLYLNSFFDPNFTIASLFARLLRLAPIRPCILAPRGEFSPGALALKFAKKRLFLRVAGLCGLYRGLTWQASSEPERRDILRTLGAIAEGRIESVPNIAAEAGPVEVSLPRQPGDLLRICFLSRISAKKNLLGALEMLNQVRTLVLFDIYGPVEDEGYWQHCREVIARLPASVSVTHRGSIPHDRVHAVLATYDLFFLPTLGENFGHVIHEALSAGTPVLIADTTPWRGLEAAGAGWDLPLDKPKAFAEVIDMMAELPLDEHVKLRKGARSLAERGIMDRGAVDASARMFMVAIGRT
ncbi:MAG: glycosyltransferase family 4 protein [Albidovulum sp.]